MNAARLQQLHEVWQPQPVSWAPQTAGWYLLFLGLIVVALWTALRAWQRWKQNRYRREALREIESCPDEQIDVLVKRCALAAWPRERVASLSGQRWLEFLDESYEGRRFTEGPGRPLAEEVYRNASSFDVPALRQLAREWIRRHRVRV